VKPAVSRIDSGELADRPRDRRRVAATVGARAPRGVGRLELRPAAGL